MKRNLAVLIGLVMLLASTGLFAEGRQERAEGVLKLLKKRIFTWYYLISLCRN
jgi:hypothetical protein